MLYIQKIISLETEGDDSIKLKVNQKPKPMEPENTIQLKPFTVPNEVKNTQKPEAKPDKPDHEGKKLNNDYVVPETNLRKKNDNKKIAKEKDDNNIANKDAPTKDEDKKDIQESKKPETKVLKKTGQSFTYILWIKQFIFLFKIYIWVYDGLILGGKPVDENNKRPAKTEDQKEPIIKPKLRSVKQSDEVETPMEKLKRLENGKKDKIYTSTITVDAYIFF